MYHGSHHVLAQIGGFLLAPMVGGFITKKAAPALENSLSSMNPTHVAAAAGALTYGALAFAAYKASENDHTSDTLQSLARGAMWGAGIGAAFCAIAPMTVTSSPMITSGVLGTTADKTFNLLTAKAAGAVAQKRASRRTMALSTAALAAK